LKGGCQKGVGRHCSDKVCRAREKCLGLDSGNLNHSPDPFASDEDSLERIAWNGMKEKWRVRWRWMQKEKKDREKRMSANCFGPHLESTRQKDGLATSKKSPAKASPHGHQRNDPCPICRPPSTLPRFAGKSVSHSSAHWKQH
jgi:hypothetical protein